MNDAPNPDLARRFIAGGVERRPSIARLEFLERFARRTPLLLEGAARDTEAVRRWDPEYLLAEAGHAELSLLAGVYEPGARAAEYRAAQPVKATLREVIQALLAEDPGKGYLFNDPSGVLRGNPDEPEFGASWVAQPNPGFARLARDFELPELVPARDLICAALVLGGVHHAAPLHYDLGGEAKALVQIRGRKRVLLFPPSDARFLYLPAWLDEPKPYRVPHVADVDVHHPDLERFPELERARCFEAILEPGDVLYWPPFWIHDVTNLDPFTLAVSCAFEELGASTMLFRESLGLMARMYLDSVEDGQAPGPEVHEAFRRLERRVLGDDVRELRTFFGWHGTVFGS